LFLQLDATIALQLLAPVQSEKRKLLPAGAKGFLAADLLPAAAAGTGVVALHCMVQLLPRRRWTAVAVHVLCIVQASAATNHHTLVKANSSPISFSLYFQKEEAIMPLATKWAGSRRILGS
jgi:hypothetical protein